MNNVSLINNNADWGGALYCRGNDVSLVNLTVSKNVSYNHDESILIADSSTKIINSIIWNNAPNHLYSAIKYAFYSDIMGNLPGIGNINADPLFVDSLNNDFRLQEGSPCIDAGIQDTIIIYNDGQDTLIIPPMAYNGSAPDMGAYEFGPSLAIKEELKNQQTYTLNQNYPNPFNPSTTIEFTLPKSEFVELKIYNILGEEVSTLISKKLNQGNHTYTFDGKNLASGIYYYQLMAGEYREVKKMILMK